MSTRTVSGKLSSSLRSEPRTGGSIPVVRGWLVGKVGERAHRTFRVRVLVQSVFAGTSLLTGIQLARFYQAAQAGGLPLPIRPPGVEAYLPISGLMGALDWIHQGTLNAVHPAATVLVLIALAMALVLRKGFCSWICPVGFFSELLARFGRWSFGKNIRPWTGMDVTLRALKYLVLGFFLWAILGMGEAGLQAFIDSPYNRVADVKMGLFFLNLSRTGVIVLGVLVLISVFVKGAWCRYLCPYGAMLGLVSWFSPTRVTRNVDPCVNCGLCDKACMARLKVSASGSISSPECTGCLDCIATCPVAGTLELKTLGRRPVSHLRFATMLVGLFLTGYLGARAAGIWANQITDSEYVERIQNLDSAAYGHPGME